MTSSISLSDRLFAAASGWKRRKKYYADFSRICHTEIDRVNYFARAEYADKLTEIYKALGEFFSTGGNLADEDTIMQSAAGIIDIVFAEKFGAKEYLLTEKIPLDVALTVYKNLGIEPPVHLRVCKYPDGVDLSAEPGLKQTQLSSISVEDIKEVLEATKSDALSFLGMALDMQKALESISIQKYFSANLQRHFVIIMHEPPQAFDHSELRHLVINYLLDVNYPTYGPEFTTANGKDFLFMNLMMKFAKMTNDHYMYEAFAHAIAEAGGHRAYIPFEVEDAEFSPTRFRHSFVQYCKELDIDLSEIMNFISETAQLNRLSYSARSISH